MNYATPEPRQRYRIDRWLIVILLIALAVRVAWALHLPNDLSSLRALPDQVEYLDSGRNLLEGHGLGFVDPRFNDAVRAFRMPGYPAFIALCGASLKAVRLVQAVLDASCVLAVYLLARRWGGRRAGLLAAILIAFNPYLIYFSGLILSETLFTAMLIWGMVFLVAKRRALAWWMGIILLILSIYVRPSALALPLVLAVVAAFVNRDGRRPYDSRWLPPVGTLALILTVLLLFPWALRNDRVLGSWIWTTTNSGITIYDGFNPDATGASDQSFVRSMPQLRSMDEVGRSSYLGDLARLFIREHPQRVAELTAIKIARTWSPVPLSNEYGSDWRLLAVSLGYMIPFYLLVVAGLRFGPGGKSVKVLLVAPAIYFTIVHALSVGSLRYRIPSDVPMAVVAGLAVAGVRTGRRLHPQAAEQLPANADAAQDDLAGSAPGPVAPVDQAEQ